MIDRVLRLVAHGVVRSIDGADIAIVVRSVCVHSDTEGALQLARALRAALIDAGVDLRPFSGVAP